jgi:hypothetical protein
MKTYKIILLLSILSINKSYRSFAETINVCFIENRKNNTDSSHAHYNARRQRRNEKRTISEWKFKQRTLGADKAITTVANY